MLKREQNLQIWNENNPVFLYRAKQSEYLSQEQSYILTQGQNHPTYKI